ncbi:hypothetical protein GW17_00043046 [Ensete ventricosum]|nr:hypothetical protein GW17_00043046 [Ensete ventricosum]
MLSDIANADLAVKSSCPGTTRSLTWPNQHSWSTGCTKDTRCRTADLAQVRSATLTCRRTPHHQYGRHGERRGSMLPQTKQRQRKEGVMDSKNHHVVVEEKLAGKRRKGKGRRKQQKEYKLLRYEELPEYMQENEFIRDYYRSEWPIRNALLSFFSWHNETLNIWTCVQPPSLLLHLLSVFNATLRSLWVLWLQTFVGIPGVLGAHLAASQSSCVVENVSCNLGNFFGVSLRRFLDHRVLLWFGCLLHGYGCEQEATAFIKLSISSETTATSSPLPAAAAVRWPFFVFLGGSMFCLLCSSACHLLCCHSHRLNLFLLRMDYVGIAVMIVTSFFPPIYYIFQCDPHWQLTYLVAISAMGFITVFTLLSPHLSTGKFRAYRALLFSGMGLFGIVPAVHATVVNWGEPQRNVTLAYEAAMAVSYLTGTAFYVTRVPERWRPGWFDLAGHSHQIFHVFVMAGALAHYGAAVIFLRWRDEVGCGTP